MLLNHEQPANRARDGTLDEQQITLRISLNHLQFLHRHTGISHMTGHARAFKHPSWRCAGANRARRAGTVRLSVRFRAASEAVPFDTALEAFTFGGSNNIDRLTYGEKTGVKLRAEFYSLQAHALAQVHLAQYLERSQFGSRTALAVLRYPEQLLDLFIFGRSGSSLLSACFAGRLLATLLLLVYLQALALTFQQWQAMSQMSQFWTCGFLQSFLLKANLDGFITIMGSRLDLCHKARASFYDGNWYYRSIRPKYLSHADFSAQQSTEHILSSLLCCRDAMYRVRISMCVAWWTRCIASLHMYVPLQLDLDIHACGQIQSCQCLNRLVGRLNNINQALVCANFELFARIFINERRAHHRIFVDFGGQWHRA